jgi:hypothetical protein
VIGGVGVASLVGAGVLFGLRQGALSDLEKSCPSRTDCPANKQSRYDDLKFYHYGSQVALGVGVVALGTAGALLFFQSRKKEPEAQTSAKLMLLPSIPVQGSDPIGATLRGAF